MTDRGDGGNANQGGDEASDPGSPAEGSPRDSWTSHYEPAPEAELTGVGTRGMWIRFGILLAVVAIPVVLAVRAGDRKLAAEGPVRGLYVWGGEVRSFQPCGDASVYWVGGPGDVVDSLGVRYRRIRESEGLGPYAPVYAEMRGVASSRRNSAFAQNFDGTFQVAVINELRALRPGECLPDDPPP